MFLKILFRHIFHGSFHERRIGLGIQRCHLRHIVEDTPFTFRGRQLFQQRSDVFVLPSHDGGLDTELPVSVIRSQPGSQQYLVLAVLLGLEQKVIHPGMDCFDACQIEKCKSVNLIYSRINIESVLAEILGSETTYQTCLQLCCDCSMLGDCSKLKCLYGIRPAAFYVFSVCRTSVRTHDTDQILHKGVVWDGRNFMVAFFQQIQLGILKTPIRRQQKSWSCILRLLLSWNKVIQACTDHLCLPDLHLLVLCLFSLHVLQMFLITVRLPDKTSLAGTPNQACITYRTVKITSYFRT